MRTESWNDLEQLFTDAFIKILELSCDVGDITMEVDDSTFRTLTYMRHGSFEETGEGYHPYVKGPLFTEDDGKGNKTDVFEMVNILDLDELKMHTQVNTITFKPKKDLSISKAPKKLPLKSRFDIFLADWRK